MTGVAIVALFCGSRHWDDPLPIAADLYALPVGSVVVTGGARGADRLAEEHARKIGLLVAVVAAPWDFYGHSAGPLRNTGMLLLNPEIVYAYDKGGTGTADMMTKAKAAGVPVHRRQG